jgi:hypothetical protein
VYVAALAESEIEGSVLTVKDSDIKAIKVLTPAEQAVADHAAEEKRLKALNADDAPDRALGDMMNGTLEVKHDLSLLDTELER